MKFAKKFSFFQSTAVIVGGIVGAGVLGLPYAFAGNGLYSSLAILVAAGIALTVLRLFYGEVVLRTRGNHQLGGYAEKYFGGPAKHIASTIFIFSTYGSLLAYMIGQGQVIQSLLGGSELLWTLGIYIILSAAVAAGLKAIESAEIFLIITLFIILAAVGFIAFEHITLVNLAASGPGDRPLLYGIALFACWGLVAIPEAKEILAESRRKGRLLAAILTGSMIPIVLYILFALLVVGVTGHQTTEVAVIGLGQQLGTAVAVGGGLFALFAMSMGFLTHGLALQEAYQYDYRISRGASILLVAVVPVALYLSGLRSFIAVMSFVGALSVGLTGLLALALYWAARFRGDREPEYSMPAWIAYPASAILFIMLVLAIVFVFI